MTEKKKSIFDKGVDALSNRDEKAELEKAKKASDKSTADAAKVAADKAAAERTAAAAKILQERTAAALAAQPKKGIVTTRSLRVRKSHETSAPVVEGLDEGAQVLILETWTDGKNTWAKIGTDKWAAMVYDGQTLMKYA